MRLGCVGFEWFVSMVSGDVAMVCLMVLVVVVVVVVDFGYDGGFHGFWLWVS